MSNVDSLSMSPFLKLSKEFVQTRENAGWSVGVAAKRARVSSKWLLKLETPEKLKKLHEDLAETDPRTLARRSKAASAIARLAITYGVESCVSEWLSGIGLKMAEAEVAEIRAKAKTKLDTSQHGAGGELSTLDRMHQDRVLRASILKYGFMSGRDKGDIDCLECLLEMVAKTRLPDIKIIKPCDQECTSFSELTVALTGDKNNLPKIDVLPGLFNMTARTEMEFENIPLLRCPLAVAQTAADYSEVNQKLNDPQAFMANLEGGGSAELTLFPVTSEKEAAYYFLQGAGYTELVPLEELDLTHAGAKLPHGIAVAKFNPRDLALALMQCSDALKKWRERNGQGKRVFPCLVSDQVTIESVLGYSRRDKIPESNGAWRQFKIAAGGDVCPSYKIAFAIRKQDTELKGFLGHGMQELFRTRVATVAELYANIFHQALGGGSERKDRSQEPLWTRIRKNFFQTSLNPNDLWGYARTIGSLPTFLRLEDFEDGIGDPDRFFPMFRERLLQKMLDHEYCPPINGSDKDETEPESLDICEGEPKKISDTITNEGARIRMAKLQMLIDAFLPPAWTARQDASEWFARVRGQQLRIRK